MLSKEKLESYMNKLSLNFEEVSANTWIIKDLSKGLENVVVAAIDPVIIIRVKVMEIPAQKRDKLFETLLSLNSSDMMHGSYAIDGKNVVIVETLLAETMDLEELQASLDAIGFALTSHYHVLQAYRN
jgi:hypothetical protein